MSALTNACGYSCLLTLRHCPPALSVNAACMRPPESVHMSTPISHHRHFTYHASTHVMLRRAPQDLTSWPALYYMTCSDAPQSHAHVTQPALSVRPVRFLVTTTLHAIMKAASNDGSL